MQKAGMRHMLSKDNPYYVPVYRMYELIYFCLQYPDWKKRISVIDFRKENGEWDDPTGEEAVERALCKSKIELVERLVVEAGGDYANYILKAVTENISYTYLRNKLDMPCGRDRFYKMWRRYFYLLSQEKHFL